MKTKILIVVMLAFCLSLSGQQRMSDEQLDILGLQADLQSCKVQAEKMLRKKDAEIAALKGSASK